MSATPSAGARRQLDALVQVQPEAGPWLALVTEAQREAADPAWEAAAATVHARHDLVGRGPDPAPVLADATVALDRATADGWLRRLLTLAGQAGSEAASLAAAAASPRLDARSLLETAVNQDADGATGQALALGVDRDALAAVAQLAATPLLQACRRALAAAVPAEWRAGCCPVCGSWPALAESRGLERARRLRCARCGADWGIVALTCPYCGANDHAQLGSLVPEAGGEARRVETCDRCRGYVKSVATLRPWGPDEVLLADLASVELDLVALERDYARPAAPAVALGLRLVDPAPDAGTDRAR